MASTLEYMQFATGVYAASVANTLNPTTASGWSFDQALWQPDTGSGFSAKLKGAASQLFAATTAMG